MLEWTGRCVVRARAVPRLQCVFQFFLLFLLLLLDFFDIIWIIELLLFLKNWFALTSPGSFMQVALLAFESLARPILEAGHYPPTKQHFPNYGA